MSDIHNQREIENLQAEIERLRAALRFYAEGEWSDGYPGGVKIDDNTLDFGEITRLRAREAELVEALEDIADGMGEDDPVEIGKYAPAIARAALEGK
jgi:hypothetical protein